MMINNIDNYQTTTTECEELDEQELLAIVGGPSFIGQTFSNALFAVNATFAIANPIFTIISNL